MELPSWIERGGAVAWRLLAMALVVLLVGWSVRALTVVTVPLAIALLLAGVLEPVVRRLDRDRLPDWVAPLVAVLAVLVLLLVAVAGLGVRLADQLPELRDEFSASLDDLEQRFSIQLPDLPGAEGSAAGSPSDAGSSTGSGPSGDDRLGDAAEIVGLGAEVLFGAFLSFAFAFLFLKDGAAMWAWALDKVDPSRRDDVDAAGRAAWGTLGAYVRGLTVVALFDAIGIGVGLLVLGVPLVLTLAALQFFASYIPTIGAFVAGAIAVVVAFGAGGPGTAALTVVLVVVVQQIGNDVVEPWVMGRELSIHPIVVLVAVGAGAVVWGIAGALLFVPLVAAGSAAAHELRVRHLADA